MATEKKAPEKWIEKNGVIRLSNPLISDGTTGPEWIDRLTKGGYHLSDWVKRVLVSDKFNPTDGVPYGVSILKGGLFSDKERIIKNVRAKADTLALKKPNLEIAPLSREKLPDDELKEMGLRWVIFMHDSLEDCNGFQNLLSMDRVGDGRWLGARVDRPDYRWSNDGGFVFVSSQDLVS